MPPSAAFVTLAALFALSSQCLASSASVVVEKRSLSSGWTRSERTPSPSVLLPLRIALRQSNLDRLHDELNAVSDPASASYGKHWSGKEVASFFAPAEDSIKAVQAWLEGAGFAAHRMKLVDGRQWIAMDVTVEEAEGLLETEYRSYDHVGGEKHIACDKYSVPAHVRAHIDLITPTVHFDVQASNDLPARHNHKKRTSASTSSSTSASSGPNGTSAFIYNSRPKIAPGGFTGTYYSALLTAGITNICTHITTLACLSDLYGYSGYEPTASANNSMAIVGFNPNSYTQTDLDLFFTTFATESIGTFPTLVSINGGVVNQTPDPAGGTNQEGDLDLEYSMPIVSPLIPQLYQGGTMSSFNNFLNAIDGSYCTFAGGNDPNQDSPGDCGIAARANVISVSYFYDEITLTPAYEIRQCNEYAKLGLLGTTVLFSSGDTGVAGSGNTCIDSNSQTLVTGGARFAPSFPSGCPYVTSVGATQLGNSAKPGGATNTQFISITEQASAQVIKSGGGFSDVFTAPAYQKKALANYFANHLPPYSAAQYNNSQTARGFPDISAIGVNYVVFAGGQPGLVYGTSASCPVVASMIVLINDARITAGKGPLGFINNALYSDAFAGAFNDIVAGTNAGCGTTGFSAVPGWDPVTGLGSPNFGQWMTLFSALP